MEYGYARVSADRQGVEAQGRQLTKAGCKKVFREPASGVEMAKHVRGAGRCGAALSRLHGRAYARLGPPGHAAKFFEAPLETRYC